MIGSLAMMLGSALVVTPDSTVTAPRNESRWIAPATVPDDHRPFRAWLVLARSRAAPDTVDIEVLASATGTAWFLAPGRECGSTSPVGVSKATAVVTWRPVAAGTILQVCVLARGEGTAYLAARVTRGGSPAIEGETIVSAPITVGAGNTSAISSELSSALLGAFVAFVLFLLQETFKRSHDRRDRAATKEEERKDRNLKLNQALTELLYAELRDNMRKLDDYLHGDTTVPPIMRVAASVYVLKNEELAAHLERYAVAGLVEHLNTAYLNANRYNSAVNKLEALAEPADAADREAASADVRKRAGSLFRAFESTPIKDGAS